MAPKAKKDATTSSSPAKKQKKGEQVAEIAEDLTPNEMKASIQRMLNFLKYRADSSKNKSGEGLSEARQVLQARTCFSMFLVCMS